MRQRTNRGSSPARADSDAQAPPNAAGTDTSGLPADDTGSVDPKLPPGSATFDASYFGLYKSYPPEQTSAGQAPLSIELVDAKPGQLMGGITAINARLATATTPSMDTTFKFDPRKDGLSGYAVVDGNGVRMQLTIKEVRSGYDLKVAFTTYKGETAEQTGTFTHGYRRNR